MSIRLLAFAAAGGACILSGQTRRAELPAPLLGEASRPVREFAMLLANFSVPSGIEIRKADAARFGPMRFDTGRDTQVAATRVVDTFNATHADYHAALTNDVLVIRPVSGAARFLDERSTVKRIDVTGMMGVLRQVFAQLVPSLGIPPTGIARSFLGGVPPDLGDEVVVRVDGVDGEKRVIDVLNDIVKQAPRTWYVETETTDHAKEPRIVRIGFLLRNGKGIFETIAVPPDR